MAYETLRILMIIGRYRPRIGGTEIQAERLARALVRKGVAVEVLTGRERGLARSEQHDGVTVRRLWTPDAGIPFLNAAALAIGLYGAILRRCDRFDILHAHQGLYPACVGIAAATRLGKPAIVKISSSGERLDLEKLSRQAGPIGRHAAGYLVLHTNTFVAVSEEIATGLRAWGVPRQRITHIPNGIEVPVITRAEARANCRKRLNVPSDKPLLLCVGNLRTVKNLPRLIAAVQLLAESGQDVNLVLLGDGPLRSNLERQAEEGRIKDHIVFKGHVANVLDYLYAADLFVLPSLVEGLSNALLEAMSVGLPCVASDIPGNRAVIQSGVNGVLFEPDSTEHLADVIAKLLANQEQAAVLGRRARETIESSYSITRVADQYISLYERLLLG